MKARVLILAALALAGTGASAFHVQIGMSGYQVRSQQWYGGFVELGATAGTIDAQVNAWYGTTPYGNMRDYIYFPSSSGFDQGYISFENNGNLRASTASHDYTSLYGAKTFTPAETVKLGTFGYQTSYHNYYWRNGVVTIRGDPYSLVMNDTGGSLTVNGVSIASRQAKPLLFPVYLSMPEIEGVKFYDLDSGTEIQPLDQRPNWQDTYYYIDGRYLLSYTGNIRISDGASSPTNHPPAEPLVFGSFKSANADKVLYAANNMPVYADGVVAMTNIALMTWWDFSHEDWGGSPQAMINGVVVCSGHSTSHIIDYTVSTDGMRVYDGIGYVDFTMSQTPQSGYSGGSCTMRCWDKSQGSGTSAYANTPAEHKAEVSAGTGVAWFRVKVNIRNGTWEVYPL